MRRNICHAVTFVITFIILFFLLEFIFFNKNNKGFIGYQWYRVQDIDDEIDVLILGNSHAYTSTNAAALSKVWGLDVEIFGGSGHSMVETLTYYNAAIKYKHPDYIFLEVKSSVSDTREELRGESRGSLINDFDGIHNYLNKLAALSRTLKLKNLPEGMFQLLRPTSMWSRWNFKETKSISFDDTHGYSKRKTYASGSRSIREVVDNSKKYRGGVLELTD